MLDLFVWSRFRTVNRIPLHLETLSDGDGIRILQFRWHRFVESPITGMRGNRHPEEGETKVSSLYDVYDPRVVASCAGFLGEGLPPLPPLPFPQYRPVESGAWRFSIIRLPAAPGYFRGPQLLTLPVAVLSRGGVSWMSTVPMEIESQMPHAAVSSGKVIVCGLGLGVMAYAVAARRTVERVVVVERDPEVVALFRSYSGLETWPQRDKIDIVIEDARAFRCADADFLYVDIWPRYRMAETIGDMQAIYRHCPAPRCGYWGQELDMVAWFLAQSAGKTAAAFDTGAVRGFAEAQGLPLIGAEIDGYAALCRSAAERYGVSQPRPKP